MTGGRGDSVMPAAGTGAFGGASIIIHQRPLIERAIITIKVSVDRWAIYIELPLFTRRY